MKKHHSLFHRVLCAVLALAAVCIGTPVLAATIPGPEPEMTIQSSHTIYYGTEANLVDGVYGAQMNVDGGGWLYVQTDPDGSNNHVTFTADLHSLQSVYAASIGTIVNGWAEKMENLTISASQDGESYTLLETFSNEDLAAEWGHRHEWICPEGAPISAQYLRFEFDMVTAQITDGSIHYVCVDEIDIRTQEAQPEPPIVDPDAGDSVNLAAGKTYTSAWAPSDHYADEGLQLTDGVYCRTLTCKAPEWVGYYNEVNDGFEFVVDLEESVGFEQIKMNFLREEGSGIPTPKSVRIELSEDGSSWRTLASTDISPIEEGIGIKRFVYTVPEALRDQAQARYVKLHINYSIWLFIDEIEIFDKETPDQGTDVPPDELPSVNLAEGLPMDCSRELLYGAADTILTDGITGGPAWDSVSWLSFNGTGDYIQGADRITMLYDLGGKKSVSQITLRALLNTANGVALPRSLKLEVSDNSERWLTLKTFGTGEVSSLDPGIGQYVWDGSVDDFLTTTENADMVYFQYLRLTFDCTDTWVSFDELTVMGKNGKCSTAGTLLGTPDGGQNLALGKSYSISHPAPTAYQDHGGTELTDGAFGSGDMYDSAWQGHLGDWPLRTIVVDLGETCAVEQVRMSFLEKSSAGIYLPYSFRVYVSNDGLTWAPLYTEKPDSLSDGVHTLAWTGGAGLPGSSTDAAKVAARYVRVDAELRGWMFFDELEVLGSAQVGDAMVLPQDANFDGAFLSPGPQTGGIRDLVLMYNGPYRDYDGNPGYGNWSKADCKPYVAYVDETGRAKDLMFDGALFLAQSSPDTDHLFIESSDYGKQPSDLTDWMGYIRKTVDRGGDMDALDAAVAEAGAELGIPELKMKVTIMVPFPDALATDFGTLNGESLDLSRKADAQKALDWYMEEVLRRFRAADYRHLDFAGFYWMHETDYRSDLIRYAGEKAQSLGLPMLWIPFYNASGWNRGMDMGLSGVALQPNHFFPDSAPSLDRIRDAAQLAKMYGLGIEIEMDDRVFNTLSKYNKYLDYLNGGLENGFIGEDTQVYRAWYNGIKTLMEAASGVNPYTGEADLAVRALYDYTYQALHGTYVPQPYRDSLDPVLPEPTEPTVPEETEPTLPEETEPTQPEETKPEMTEPEETIPTEAETEPSETTAPTEGGDSSNPATGDEANPVLWLALTAVSLIGAFAVLPQMKRRYTGK